MVYSHRLKKTFFLNRPVSVCLQNENGPCPLLSIANVLILQGDLKIHPDRSEITSDQLIEMIGTHLIDRNPPLEDEELRKNQQQTLDDIIAILPTLQHGLDVNVRFNSVKSFEYDARISVFDMLGINLFHGWIADPNDEETYETVSKYSYNQLVDRIIMADVQATQKATKPQEEEQSKSEDDETKEEALSSAKEADLEEESSIEEAVTEKVKEVKEDFVEDELLTKEARVAQRFLQETASQLTYLGLSDLHDGVNERSLGVFFRNNHFATLFKLDGHLYLLLTDHGYEKQNAVAWEKLNEINGDTEIVSPEFSDPNAYTFIHEDMLDTSPDRQLAMRLQQEENQRGGARTVQRQPLDVQVEEQRRALAAYKAQHQKDQRKGRRSRSKSPQRQGEGKSSNCSVS